MIEEYLKNIANTTAQGDAREESYYGHFSNFLAEFANYIGKTNTQITTLPKKTEAGNPDFRVWDGRQHIVGYIEAKKPGENLAVIETSKQLKRYTTTFPNVILTDFYEFRLYRHGQLIENVTIGRRFIAKKLKTIPQVENEAKFISLLEMFFSFSLPKVYTSENLAIELAKRTRFLRDEVIIKELEEAESGKGKIYGFYQAFKQYLVSNLTPADFADIYSQTIAYGLFAARTRANGEFTRVGAYELIPPTIGILKDVFQFISLGKVPLNMGVIVEDIAEVLQVADVGKILHEFYTKGKGEDPIVHFYETFLNIYDPATREKRGVYYTPEPVVKYIVRAIHSLLKSHFNLTDGLASKDVTLLDPAAGTLTFPAEAIKLAVNEFAGKYGDGGKKKFIQNHILKNFYAFELMMAPYAIGHIKISFLLEELGYQMQEDDRFKLYLTNTLDMEDLKQTQIPGLSSLSEESHLAGKIKQNEPVLVIMGNPPYSGHSANNNDWTKKLLKENIDGAQNYFEVDGKPLGEKNPKSLQDDYVKFLRFAQWKIHKAGQGIVGMITNHSYLDNPTFRGMRQSLMNTFNEIYIIDLHGNALKKETSPDGSKDENVFDIRQGTAIAIFLKTDNTDGCKVFHKDIQGLRKEKYDWLEKTNFKTKDYTLLAPVNPWYFFIPRETKGIEYFNKWPRINEIFPVNSVGIVTARDEFAIAETKSILENRIRNFRNLSFDISFLTASYNLKNSSGFDLAKARIALSKDETHNENYHEIAYRPFDKHVIYYSPHVIERMRYEVMQHMIKDNLGLVSVRQVKASPGWQHALITNSIIESCYISNKTSEISYIFPLYLYPPEQKKKGNILQNIMLFEPEAEYEHKTGKVPNISPVIFEKLEKLFGEKPTPENILSYCYAVLYCNLYREKYAEFLKIDFPRIPFTSDYSLFKQMAGLGSELIELHLLKHPCLNNPIVKYMGDGDDKIEKITFIEKERRVYINGINYFENITSEIWNYRIGGYQVMEKFLKDRKGKQLNGFETYCKIGTTILQTTIIQAKLDGIFQKLENKIIE